MSSGIEKATDFFDRIRVINLDKDKDMMQNFRKESKEAGFQNIERFSAIKHKNGYKGVKQSHLSVIKDAYESSSFSVLIFEDDCEFVPNFQKRLQKYVFELKTTSWALFYLAIGFGPEDKYTPEPVGDHLFRLKHGWFNHAYAVNTSHPGLMKRFRDTESGAIDRNSSWSHYLSNEIFDEFPCFCSRNILALQKPRISNNEHEFKNFVPPMLRHFEEHKTKALS